VTVHKHLTPYPSYDVLSKQHSPSWDELTREVVQKRLEEPPPRRFFSEHEWRTLEAVCARLVPQPDRPRSPIPIVPFIDGKLFANQTDGQRYESLPPMQEAYQRALRGLDDDAKLRWNAPFVALSSEQQDELLGAVQNGKVSGEGWLGMPADKFFTALLISDVVAIYYAHPLAWSEIGFGGPASPRGYVRLEANEFDPWEAPPERRAEAPPERRGEKSR